MHQYFDGLEIVPTQTFTSDFVEDPLNTMWIYRDSLTNVWWMWSAGGSEPLSDVSAPTGYQSNHSIRVPLSKMETLFLVRDSTSLNISKYKWIEFFIMVGNNQPENLSVTLQDWSPGAPYYRNALVKDSRYIEGGEFQPGIWQRVRIPLVDLGITNVRFETTSVFIIHNWLGFQCGSDSIADDIYIDNILLVAGK